MNNLRKLFPMLKNKIVYLDSGALVQKPKKVIDAINEFYTKFSISNRTSDSKLGIIVNQKINDTRKLTAELLNASTDEIMFNSGTTEGLNYAAQILEDIVDEKNEIIISKYNHSSHMIPWIELSKRKGCKIVFSDNILDDINAKTKIIAFTQTTNNFNKAVDIEELYKKAKKFNSIIVNDAAQAISHEKVDAYYFDVIAFSCNKLFGPTGLGILYVDNKLLQKLNSKKYGGGAIDYVDQNGDWKPKESIQKHEPGTLNLSSIFGFYESLLFFNSLDLELVQNYLKQIANYAYDQLSQVNNLVIESNRGDNIILFRIKNISSQDVASYLGHKDIYVRSGVFCAQYLNHIIEDSLVRVSLHVYNNKKDIDILVKELKNGGDFIEFL